MRLIRKAALTVVASMVMSAVPVIVQAQGIPAFYVGASAGMTDHGTCEISPSPTSCDTSSTGYKGFVGYQVNEWFGVEAGYANLGKTEAVVLSQALEYKASAIPIQATLGYHWSNGLGVFGKVGGAYWSAKSNYLGSEVKETGFGFAGGVGVQWFFTGNVGVRAEFEYFPGVGKETTSGQADIGLFTAGVVVKF